MHSFKLPLISGATLISNPVGVNAFAPMIDNRTSGLVVSTNPGFRLLHFSQIWSAHQQQLERVVDIPGYWRLDDVPQGRNPTQLPSGRDYWLAELEPEWATVCSRHEWQAEMFLITNPGFCCDAKKTNPTLPTHYYPPNTKGIDDHCTVVLCPGEVP